MLAPEPMRHSLVYSLATLCIFGCSASEPTLPESTNASLSWSVSPLSEYTLSVQRWTAVSTTPGSADLRGLGRAGEEVLKVALGPQGAPTDASPGSKAAVFAAAFDLLAESQGASKPASDTGSFSAAQTLRATALLATPEATACPGSLATVRAAAGALAQTTAQETDERVVAFREAYNELVAVEQDKPSATNCYSNSLLSGREEVLITGPIDVLRDSVCSMPQWARIGARTFWKSLFDSQLTKKMLDRYISCTGGTLQVSTQEIKAASIRIETPMNDANLYAQLQRLDSGSEHVLNIEATVHAKSQDLGTSTARLSGTMKFTNFSIWSFSGTAIIEDRWDFDIKPDGQRNPDGAQRTKVGAYLLPGRAFDIRSAKVPVERAAQDGKVSSPCKPRSFNSACDLIPVGSPETRERYLSAFGASAEKWIMDLFNNQK